MGNVYLGDKKVTSDGWYLGDAPLFEETLFPIEIDGVTYEEEDAHIFVANGKTVKLPILANDSDPCSAVFVAVDGVEVTPTYVDDNNPNIDYDQNKYWTITANENQTIHAIFDWHNENGAHQTWFSDILQFGLNSETGKRNQIKNGYKAFFDLKTSPDAISNLDTSNVTDMEYMFQASLLNLDISRWDTSKVTNMNGMFNSAKEFNQDISNWDTSKVENMKAMFYGASSFDQPLSGWDTSSSKNMSYMFNGSKFNSDISGWDTSNVETMSSMFAYNWEFNKDISEWDTSSLKSMDSMFSGARTFNQDISKWNTSSVTTINAIFNEAYSFNQDISGWDTSSVTKMDFAFNIAASFNQDLSKWCVTNIGSKPEYFDNSANKWEGGDATRPDWGTCRRGENIQLPDGVLPGEYELEDCHIFTANANAVNLPIPNNSTPIFVAVDRVKKDYATEVKGRVFNGKTIHAIFDWDNPNSVRQDWFSDIIQFGLNSEGERNQLKNGKYAFYYMEANPAAIVNLDVSNVTNMGYMFYSNPFNQDISNWDTSKVTNMEAMFNNAREFNQDLSQWCVSQFPARPRLFDTNADKWTEPKPDWGKCPRFENIELEDFHIFIANGNPVAFAVANDSDVKFVKVDGVAKNYATEVKGQVFDNSTIHAIFDWDNPNRARQDWFSDITQFGLNSITGERNQLKNGLQAFVNITANPAAISNLDVSNLTDTSAMFQWSLIDSDLSGWDVSNVTTMFRMFYGAQNFNQDISGWNTSSVENMMAMFDSAKAFNQDLSEWCVSLIGTKPDNFNTYSGFEGQTAKEPQWGECPRGEDIGLPNGYSLADCHIFVANWNAVRFPIPNNTTPIFVAVDGVKKNYATEVKGKVFDGKTIHAIFDWNNASYVQQDWFKDILQFGLNEDTGERNQLKSGKYAFYLMKANSDAISNLDTSNLTNMNSMFNSAYTFNKPLSEWDTSKVTNMESMFNEASNFNKDISKWDTSNVMNMGYMFSRSSLNQDISGWNTSKVTNMTQMFFSATIFNQDLSQWCVSQFAEKPDDFDTSAYGWQGYEATRPQWRTCPRGEDKA